MDSFKEEQKISVPRVIAVTSGKGGTGKTFITVNLAKVFSQQGKHVVLLDGDFGLANIHLLLGKEPCHDLEAIFSGECEIEDVLMPVSEKLAVIPGGRGKPFMSQLNSYQLLGLISAMDAIKKVPDILLIDTAGTVSAEELQLIAAAGEVIIVLNPDMLSLQDTADYIRQLNICHHIQRFLLITNLTKNHREEHNILEKLQCLVGFDVDVILKPLGNVPKDEFISKSIMHKSSVMEFLPESKMTKHITEITEKLCREPVRLFPRGGLTFFYEHHIMPYRGV